VTISARQIHLVRDKYGVMVKISKIYRDAMYACINQVECAEKSGGYTSTL